MKIWLMIVLLLVTGQVWGQEGTTLEVCEAWSQHIHNDEEQAAYDQVCADVDTAPLAQPPAETTVASDDLATTEEAEIWVQLFDSGNQFAPTAAGLWLDEDFLGDVEILIGGVTCDIYDEYLLAGEWAIIPLCSSSNDPGYLDAPDTLRVEMQEDWGEPTSYFRCVEDADSQEEERRMYACEFLRSR